MRKFGEDLTIVSNYLTGKCRENGASFFKKVHSEKTREDQHKLECGKFCSNTKKNKFSMSEVRHWNSDPEVAWSFHP